MSENRAEYGENQLRSMRDTLGWSQIETARILKTPLRTYTGYEAGEARTPGAVLVAMALLIERQHEVLADILRRVDERIRLEYPHGIPSEPYREE